MYAYGVRSRDHVNLGRPNWRSPNSIEGGAIWACVRRDVAIGVQLSLLEIFLLMQLARLDQKMVLCADHSLSGNQVAVLLSSPGLSAVKAVFPAVFL